MLETYWCSVLAVLVGNLLHCRVAHEVGGLVTPVLHGCAVWGTQGRVGSQVNALQIDIPDEHHLQQFRRTSAEQIHRLQ